jgi:hypothetical protein
VPRRRRSSRRRPTARRHLRPLRPAGQRRPPEAPQAARPARADVVVRVGVCGRGRGCFASCFMLRLTQYRTFTHCMMLEYPVSHSRYPESHFPTQRPTGFDPASHAASHADFVRKPSAIQSPELIAVCRDIVQDRSLQGHCVASMRCAARGYRHKSTNLDTNLCYRHAGLSTQRGVGVDIKGNSRHTVACICVLAAQRGNPCCLNALCGAGLSLAEPPNECVIPGKRMCDAGYSSITQCVNVRC